MQIWIFFDDGAGGDSFANLLESASNVEALDNEKSWRIHRYVDYRPKFWMPCPDQTHCFTNLHKSAREIGYAFRAVSNVLSDRYKTLISTNGNVIVTSRDTELNFLLSSDCLDILTQDQIKILLKRKNQSTILHDATTKNLLEVKSNINYRYIDVDESMFDLVVYFEDLLDWEFVKKLSKQLNLDIDNNKFLHWQKIIQQKIFYTTPGIKYYQSYIDHSGIYRYKEITTPNFNGVKTINHFN